MPTGKNFERLLLEGAFPDAPAIDSFQSKLISWFEENQARYPWRETRDPYAILVSELMLQQTRIATVLERGYYIRWMKRFPDWKSLARADEEEILKAWEGLGYYNRARNLQKAAQVICDQYDGFMPSDHGEIMALPGVGPYTAGAVCSFAFGKRAAIVDGNVIRVLARIFSFEDPVDTPSAKKAFWRWAEDLTPDQNFAAYNSGIMELGQKVCLKGAPRCGDCPVSGHCRTAHSQLAAELPRKSKKATVTHTSERVALAIVSGKILLEKEEGGRRKGMWKLPELPEELAADSEEWIRCSYAITRYKVELMVFLPAPASRECLARKTNTSWFFFNDNMEDLPPLGSPYRKVITRWLDESLENLI
ncbi:MAG: A/G-specific adenine glycosylase [Verrucomicrobiales bacterium]|nr:A/G-specific adenine glycosylase [Verrucomicrobiales bacterium]